MVEAQQVTDTNEHDDDEPADDAHTIDDDTLASLLESHNETETVEHQAELVATFYVTMRNRIDPVLTSSGDIHDAALELTREWMTYTIGGM